MFLLMPELFMTFSTHTAYSCWWLHRSLPTSSRNISAAAPPRLEAYPGQPAGSVVYVHWYSARLGTLLVDSLQRCRKNEKECGFVWLRRFQVLSTQIEQIVKCAAALRRAIVKERSVAIDKNQKKQTLHHIQLVAPKIMSTRKA